MSAVFSSYFVLFSIAYLVLFEVLDLAPTSESFLWFSSLVLIVNYVLSIVFFLKQNKSLVSIFFFLILSCFIFNSGQSFLYIFDIDIRHSIVFYNCYPLDIVCKSLWFQGCCLLGMCAGANISLYNDNLVLRSYCSSFYKDELPAFNWMNIGFIFFSILSFYLYADRLVARSSMAYMDFMMGGYQESSIASFVRVMLCMFTSVCFFKHNSRKWIWFIIGINVAMMFLMLLTGSRFKLVPIVACLLFVFYEVKQKYFLLTNKKKLVFIVFFFLLFSLMRGWTFLRNESLSSLDIQMITSMYTDGLFNGFADTMAECGSSIICLLCSVFQVDVYGAGGQTFLYSLLMSVVPYNLLDYLGLVPEVTDLARWVTKLEGASVGLGYSIFGEFYYNCRSLGFILAFFFGLVFVYLEKKVKYLFYSSEPVDWLLAGCVLCMLADSIFLGRANFLLITTNMRICFYIILIRYFTIRFSKGK